jgi:hypothetical protein
LRSFRDDAEDKDPAFGRILGAFGEGRISREQFWAYMRQYGLTDADIDAWCDQNCVWCPDEDEGAVDMAKRAKQ